MPLKAAFERRVFLNIPYDTPFQDLYLAYIVGLVQLGLLPVVTLEIAKGGTRVDRIYSLLSSCRYSIHDLSRIQVSGKPRVPRFNMPFELGIAFTLAKQSPAKHEWIVFDSVRFQAQRSLSDLAGTDFNIHRDTAKGIMSGLCSVFSEDRGRPPNVPQMLRNLEFLRATVPALKQSCGVDNTFEAQIFRELVLAAQKLVADSAS